MIPATLLLVWKYRRLAGYVLAAAAILVLAWRIAAWRDGYQKLAIAEKSLIAEKQAHNSTIQRYNVEIARSQAERERFQADLTAIRAKFAALPVPPPETLVARKEIPLAPGQVTCPDVRISPAFRSLWNDAGIP